MREMSEGDKKRWLVVGGVVIGILFMALVAKLTGLY